MLRYEVKGKNADLETMKKSFVGRELKMVELKERIRRLETELRVHDEVS